MEEILVKPKYSIVNVYFGFVFSFLGVIFFLWMAIIFFGHSNLFFLGIACLILSALLGYAVLSSLSYYPRELIVHEDKIVAKMYFLPDLTLSLFETKAIRFLKHRIEFETHNLYFGGVIDQDDFVRLIVKRMQKLNIPINFDEGINMDVSSFINEYEEEEL